ncbi:galactose-1-phosphate uridylyltransferase [Methanosphaerula palustris]|uniref:Galactose-1-phosphate uridylyltransferase-like protein n=1 Tax=Methanosphaerula palustris (strain ATCC BAA-1556 / DSM 19958 / E1-9c) TaxID=521011 RepID=B8GJQ6_METPE|nr:galactose-1-phosphate uridylyltransferase [Methanosphaerula palustris]ACL15710.1 galactose-1-phosphate uridylyltransferase-like protein [Methanosphaerula palustris E1-9c]
MFSIEEQRVAGGIIQYRLEHLTGLRCTISPTRLKRRLNGRGAGFTLPSVGCPFCPETLESMTPVFPDGTRIHVGESVTFPNLYPYAPWHTVTVITTAHEVRTFLLQQLMDALTGQVQSLHGHQGYPSINWNYLPSAGASIAHPHLQGLVERRASPLLQMYLTAGERYRDRHRRTYWEVLRERECSSDRYLFGDEIVWTAHAVPLGEQEVRALLPIATIDDLEPYLELFAAGMLRILSFYAELGTSAFNASLFFDRGGRDRGFSAFCSMIARINPNIHSAGDTAFMERLHLNPVILTLPEEFGRYARQTRT